VILLNQIKQTAVRCGSGVLQAEWWAGSAEAFWNDHDCIKREHGGNVLMMLKTPRTRLRAWQPVDRHAFAAMNADPEVMHDLGGPLSRVASDAKFDRYAKAFDRLGFCRWAIEDRDGSFVGYAGVMPAPDDHPLGAHFEIGWRLVRNAWGKGYATEAASAALDDVFDRVGLKEVLAYTAPDNFRSQRVMQRLRLQREPSRDFVADYANVGRWRGLVSVARPGMRRSGS
jgi:RimJ/RimL family protein N-acetyltransferase